MSLDNVTPGKQAPETFNVIIEIPMNSDPTRKPAPCSWTVS
jgi:inorganic pyrophosphatase